MYSNQVNKYDVTKKSNSQGQGEGLKNKQKTG